MSDQTHSKPSIEDRIQELFSAITAAEAAELVLSPSIDPKLFHVMLTEQGPPLWVVNRSDVYTSTLEMLSAHRDPQIAGRAKEKIKLRLSDIAPWDPPTIDGPLAELPDYEIENLLGHPLVPLEAAMHFAHHTNEDFRASAALSVTRRLLEFPPPMNEFPRGLHQVFTQVLFEDLSPMVRAYAARLPIFDELRLIEAFSREHHPMVKARILQNPGLTRLPDPAPSFDDTLDIVTACDQRWPLELRKKISRETQSPLGSAIHEWYLLG